VIQGAVFIFLGVIAILSSLGVVMQRNPVHCLLALIITLISIGALFISLGAVTVGFLQIIVYVGAIMVLFLFVIWLLNLQTEQSEQARAGGLGVKFFATIAVAGLAAELFTIMSKTTTAVGAQTVAEGYGSIDSLAETLFGQYLMAFETTSILLLVAVVGAVAVARRALPERREAPTQGKPT
jgi:NADH-quinone oxidoreductase subunit J